MSRIRVFEEQTDRHMIGEPSRTCTPALRRKTGLTPKSALIFASTYNVAPKLEALCMGMGIGALALGGGGGGKSPDG